MKILHIVDYLMPTMGYQEFILPKFNAMNKNHHVSIITGNKFYPVPNYNNTWKKFLGERSFAPKVQKLNRVKIIRNKILFEIAKRPWILNLERDIKILMPDIIMCHGTASFSSIRSILIAKKLKIPIFLDNHMILSVTKKNFLGKVYYFIIRNFVAKFIEKNSNIIFGVTKETCKYLIEEEGYSKSKVQLLPLGTDSKIFYPKKKNKIKKKIRVIQTGKLNYDKRPDFLAQAIILLIDEGFDIELIYYGSGELKIINYIKGLFLQKGYTLKLKFRRMQKYKKLGNIYRNADVVVFPYGTSLSAIDASFCGTPVVMTDDIASKEKKNDGIGICYKSGNVEDLAKKIKYCIKNKSKFKLKKSIFNKVRKKYDYEYISEYFLKYCIQEINIFKKEI